MPRRSRRTFAAEFEAKVCRKHQLSPTLLAPWKATLLERLPTVSQADDRRAAEADRVAELERLVGQHALELSALKVVSAGAAVAGGPDRRADHTMNPSPTGLASGAHFNLAMEREWREVLPKMGTTQFGRPPAEQAEKLAAIESLPRPERLAVRLLKVNSWDDLLKGR